MRILFALLLLVGLVPYAGCQAQKPGRLTVAIPSIEQEATSIWRTINDVDFFISQGYNYTLPEHPLISKLVGKSQQGLFGNDDYATIYALLESEIYREADYELALAKVNAEEVLMNELIQKVLKARSSWDWDFKVYEEYAVVFTLYGSGGSYNPANGTITLLTNTEGKFKRYKSPVNTIIHEFIHLGVEESIAQKYRLSHIHKENLVDQLVYLMFKKELPNYKIQPMGDGEVGELIKRKKGIKRLSDLVVGLGGR